MSRRWRRGRGVGVLRDRASPSSPDARYGDSSLGFRRVGGDVAMPRVPPFGSPGGESRRWDAVMWVLSAGVPGGWRRWRCDSRWASWPAASASRCCARSSGCSALATSTELCGLPSDRHLITVLRSRRGWASAGSDDSALIVRALVWHVLMVRPRLAAQRERFREPSRAQRRPFPRAVGVELVRRPRSL
jgi:hypothetical protein